MYCLQCNNKFEDKPRKKYCSKQCAKLFNRKPHSMIESSCLICNKKHISSDGRNKYCSAICKGLSRRIINNKKQLFNKPCLACNAIFETRTSYRQYCSDTCKIKVKNSKNKCNRRQPCEGMSTDLVKLIYAKYNYQCVYCNYSRGIPGRKLSIDHLTPVCRGGDNNESNLVIACHGKGGCNTIKNNRTLIEYIFNCPIRRKKRKLKPC
jgi:hypothetical protein